MRKPELGQLVMLEWLDAHSVNGGWTEVKDVAVECRCWSVGWVIRIERDYVLISGSFSDDGKSKSVGDAISIPWGMVQDIDVLDKLHVWKLDVPVAGEQK